MQSQKEYPVMEETSNEKNIPGESVLAYRKEDVSHLEALNLTESEAEELAALEKSSKVSRDSIEAINT